MTYNSLLHRMLQAMEHQNNGKTLTRVAWAIQKDLKTRTECVDLLFNKEKLTPLFRKYCSDLYAKYTVIIEINKFTADNVKKNLFFISLLINKIFPKNC